MLGIKWNMFTTFCFNFMPGDCYFWPIYARYCRGYTNFCEVHCKACCLKVTKSLLILRHIPHITVQGGETVRKATKKCQFLRLQTRKGRCTHSGFCQDFQAKLCTSRPEIGFKCNDNDSVICAWKPLKMGEKVLVSCDYHDDHGWFIPKYIPQSTVGGIYIFLGYIWGIYIL